MVLYRYKERQQEATWFQADPQKGGRLIPGVNRKLTGDSLVALLPEGKIMGRRLHGHWCGTCRPQERDVRLRSRNYQRRLWQADIEYEYYCEFHANIGLTNGPLCTNMGQY